MIRRLLIWLIVVLSCTGCSMSSPSSDTATAIASPTAMLTPIGRIYLMRFPVYEAIDMKDLPAGLTTASTVLNEGTPNPPNGMPQGLGGALVTVVSHFSKQVAYWVRSGAGGELWIADLAYQHPQRIFVDKDGKYASQSSIAYDKALLIWSPDDRYLMIDATLVGAPNMLYQVQDQKLETWPWECNELAISPQTNRLALWCRSTEGKSGFASLEWNAAIRYSTAGPTNLLAQRMPNESPTWAWSSSDSIAYFDSSDTQKRLFIADSGGVRSLLPGIAQFGSIVSYATEFSSRHLIQWSADGRRLLVYGQGKQCPQRHNAATGELQSYACWQVVDAQSGEIIWTTLDLVNLWPDKGMADTEIQSAIFSPDGNFVALGAYRGGPKYLVVASLATKTATIIENYNGTDMYWTNP
jgi:hypothetical protein